MRKIFDLPIGLRLIVIINVLVILLVGSLGFYVVKLEMRSTLEDTSLRMTDQVADLEKLVLQQVADNQKIVTVGINAAEQYIKTLGNIEQSNNNTVLFNAINQVTKQSKTVDLPAWFLNGEMVQNSTNYVDRITELTGATATIFQKIDGGYLRISTNVKNDSGQRAVGTYIPMDSPVAQAINSRQDYFGRAFVVDDWYLTAYRPIVINNEVEGILYVGVPEKDMKEIKEIFSNKKYFDTGYPYIVSKDGILLVHPTDEGKSITSETFFTDMLNSKSNIGSSIYQWNGKNKHQYYRYIDAIGSYVAVTVYESEIMESAHRIRNAVIVFMAIGIVIFILIIFGLVQNISQNLKKAVITTKAIADGDLNQVFELNQKDEIGQMAKALTEMTQGLKSIVENIKSGAGNISSASQELSSASMQISEGATEQASSIEEVSSTMEEITANIQQNTDNANQTSKVSQEANSGIKEVAARSSQVVEANKTIAEKITIINDIAFQTNILALNAAVEAARAGEHGRGFAVVAAEVRKLAERSKVAADEIVTLAKSSLDLSVKAKEVMENTIPKIENTTQLLLEISAASNEQNNGASQVNNAIQQLNYITQQNASSSEELAASAELLAGQAVQLNEAISFFKID